MTTSKRIHFYFAAVCLLGMSLISLKSHAQGLQSGRQIELLNANTIEFDKSLGNGAKRLIGNVRFKQNNAIMTCDSAYFYEDNTVDAFSHIHINQGDTVHLYGDLLRYNGNEKMAHITNNVRLVDRNTVLVTKNIDYNTRDNIAYYVDGGKITNGPDNLESTIGYYYANEKMFYFRRNVVVRNPKYVIKSDTLKYQTIIRQAYFLGPTTITSKENFIYCENGWYNTMTNKAQFQKNAYLKGKGQIIKGDSLFYDRNKSFGRAIRNVSIVDSARNVTLTGHYGEYYEKPEAALMTQHARLIKVDSKGDSLFAHADTLRMNLDTTGIHRRFYGYHGARFYKSDIQGICDSLSFSFIDSTFKMYGHPVLWSGENQITSDYIDMLTANNQMKEMHMKGVSMIVSKEDSVKFNQVKGRDMLGTFKDNELVRIDVTGNSQTVYYPKDGPEIIGMNKAESSDLIIFLENRKVHKIRFITQPAATLYPLKDAPDADKFLRGFKWFGELRPVSANDIFREVKPVVEKSTKDGKKIEQKDSVTPEKSKTRK
jgi:lipopolysaccharide export system protein LptA